MWQRVGDDRYPAEPHSSLKLSAICSGHHEYFPAGEKPKFGADAINRATCQLREFTGDKITRYPDVGHRKPQANRLLNQLVGVLEEPEYEQENLRTLRGFWTSPLASRSTIQFLAILKARQTARKSLDCAHRKDRQESWPRRPGRTREADYSRARAQGGVDAATSEGPVFLEVKTCGDPRGGGHNHRLSRANQSLRDWLAYAIDRQWPGDISQPSRGSPVSAATLCAAHFAETPSSRRASSASSRRASGSRG